LARTDHWMDGSSTDMFNINGGHSRQYIDATYSRHGYYTGLILSKLGILKKMEANNRIIRYTIS